MDNYIITIARGFGSGGKYIGTKLSEQLGIPLYDDQFHILMEEKYGINRKLVSDDVNESNLKVWMKRLKKFPADNYSISAKDNFKSNINLYKMQALLIEHLAKTDSFIIMGKCANNILKGRDNVVSFHISTDFDSAIESIVNRTGCTPIEAQKAVAKTDKYRRYYYEYYTGGKKWDKPSEYDLMINSGKIGRENVLKVITDYLETKGLINKD